MLDDVIIDLFMVGVRTPPPFFLSKRIVDPGKAHQLIFIQSLGIRNTGILVNIPGSFKVMM